MAAKDTAEEVEVDIRDLRRGIVCLHNHNRPTTTTMGTTRGSITTMGGDRMRVLRKLETMEIIKVVEVTTGRVVHLGTAAVEVDTKRNLIMEVAADGRVAEVVDSAEEDLEAVGTASLKNHGRRSLAEEVAAEASAEGMVAGRTRMEDTSKISRKTFKTKNKDSSHSAKNQKRRP